MAAINHRIKRIEQIVGAAACICSDSEANAVCVCLTIGTPSKSKSQRRPWELIAQLMGFDPNGLLGSVNRTRSYNYG
jgi:hypothetical protein